MPAKPHTALPVTHRVPTHLSLRFRQVCLSLQDEAITGFGIRPLHSGILMELRHHADGIDQTRLAAVLGRDQASVGQNIDELVAMGAVERRVAPGDRRARLVSLTPAGRDLQRRLAPVLGALQARILSPLSPEEAETLLALLVRVVEAHEAHARPGAARRRPQRRHAAPAPPPPATGGPPCDDPPKAPPSPAGPPSA